MPKPIRFEVIADYPGSPFIVKEIIELKDKDISQQPCLKFYLDDGTEFWYESDFKQYPCIFKQLPFSIEDNTELAEQNYNNCDENFVRNSERQDILNAMGFSWDIDKQHWYSKFSSVSILLLRESTDEEWNDILEQLKALANGKQK